MKRTLIIVAFCLGAGLTLTSCEKRPGKTIDQSSPSELEQLRADCLQVLTTNSYVFVPYEETHIVGRAFFVTNANLRQELGGWLVMLDRQSINHPQHISLWAMGVDTREHIIVGARDFTCPTNEGWRKITDGIYIFPSIKASALSNDTRSVRQQNPVMPRALSIES